RRGRFGTSSVQSVPIAATFSPPPGTARQNLHDSRLVQTPAPIPLMQFATPTWNSRLEFDSRMEWALLKMPLREKFCSTRTPLQEERRHGYRTQRSGEEEGLRALSPARESARQGDRGLARRREDRGPGASGVEGQRPSHGVVPGHRKAVVPAAPKRAPEDGDGLQALNDKPEIREQASGVSVRAFGSISDL